MKNFLKKINKVGLLAFVAGLLLIGTQSAFKAGSVLTPPVDGWYTVTITNPSFPEVAANQRIDGLTPLEGEDIPPLEDELGCAQTLNTGNKCAVYLTFDIDATAIPATVADVNAEYETISGTSRQPL